MAALRQRWRDLPLRRFLMLTVLGALVLVAVLSGLVLWGCIALRTCLLPDSNEVYLTIQRESESGVMEGSYRMEFDTVPEEFPQVYAEGAQEAQEGTVKYSIQKIERSVDSLTPKRKLAYQALGLIMVAAPTFFSFGAILLCSLYFYRRKLREPLELLGVATEKIARQDLDFTIDYKCSDELGRLSRSFENMRLALLKSNRAMWEMMEERRLLQASVAHDLRNPIAIIEGYTEYLENGFQRGGMPREKLFRILRNLNLAAKRLGDYTESVRLWNQWSEAEPDKKYLPAAEMAEAMAVDFGVLCEKRGMMLKLKNTLPVQEIFVDETLLHRVLENIVTNGLRYARKEISMEFVLCRSVLTVTVRDDGEGFSREALKGKGKSLLSAGKDGHLGIGLSVSRLLCEKHGGGLEIANGSKGACVKVWLEVGGSKESQARDSFGDSANEVLFEPEFSACNR